MKVDLNTCYPGQKLRSVHGKIFTYVGLNKGDFAGPYRHLVKYPGAGESLGSRTDDGQTYVKNKYDSDEDIVEIIVD